MNQRIKLFVDFDGTLIPDFPYENEKDFKIKTLNSLPLGVRLESDDWYILTDRPESEFGTIRTWCDFNGYNPKGILSSHGKEFSGPSIRRRIISSKIGIMLYHTWRDNEFYICKYIDKDVTLCNFINDIYKKVLSEII